MTAFLRSLSGANMNQATIPAYRIDLSQFTDFLSGTNRMFSSPADVDRGDSAENLAYAAEVCDLSAPTEKVGSRSFRFEWQSWLHCSLGR